MTNPKKAEQENMTDKPTSPYAVHSLMYITSSGQQGLTRSDGQVSKAHQALLTSLWRLEHLRPEHLFPDECPMPEDDINSYAPFAAAVAFDAGRLCSVLRVHYPEQDYEIDVEHSKLMTELLAGSRTPSSTAFLMLNEDFERKANVQHKADLEAAWVRGDI